MGIWAVPNTVKKAERLKKLLTKNLSRAHAEAEMYLLLGFDSLFDDFKETVRGDDMRPFIVRRLKEILDMPHDSFSAKWEPEARSICESIIAEHDLQEDLQLDKPIVFVAWSVLDIVAMVDESADDLDMSVEEIHAALVYAAKKGYHSSEDTILDSVIEAHKVLNNGQSNHISEAEFIEHYQPLPNELNDNASYDFGNGGCLYETYGAELEHIKRQPVNRVWTILDGEYSPVIASGFHLVNRLGYILTAMPCDNDTDFEVLLD